LDAAAGGERSLYERIPAECRGLLAAPGRIALALPGHTAPRLAAHLLGLPLALAYPAATVPTPESLRTRRIDGLGLILDAGALGEAPAPTVVRLDGKKATVQRPGAIAEADVEDAARCRIVFVCTGNTCRSPMAQALCRKLLADWLGCAAGELAERGYVVQSAGMAALGGDEASPEGVALMREWGADLEGHRSRPLDYETIARADFIFAMTQSHLRMLREVQGDAGPSPRLLSCGGDDIADPIGGPPEVYRECAEQIRSCLEELLPQLQENG
jgi:protein-tyrosine phosphatase